MYYFLWGFPGIWARDWKVQSVNKGICFIETRNKNFSHLPSYLKSPSSYLWDDVLKAACQNQKLFEKDNISFMLYILWNKTCGQWFVKITGKMRQRAESEIAALGKCISHSIERVWVASSYLIASDTYNETTELSI